MSGPIVLYAPRPVHPATAPLFPDSLAARSRGRDNHFNLIRMIAASGVLVSHAWPLSLGSETPEPLETLLRGDNLGRLCVFIFFAVSGFFITRSFIERRSLRDFVTARVLRLFPGLLVMTVVVAALIAVLAAPDPVAVLRQDLIWIARALRLKGPEPLAGVFADNPLPDAINGSLWTLT